MHHALRGDLGDVRIERKGQNYIYRKGKSWAVHVGQHKTVKSVAIDLKLAKPVSDIDIFLPMVRANTDRVPAQHQARAEQAQPEGHAHPPADHHSGPDREAPRGSDDSSPEDDGTP